jgi:hypothetical protein
LYAVSSSRLRSLLSATNIGDMIFGEGEREQLGVREVFRVGGFNGGG